MKMNSKKKIVEYIIYGFLSISCIFLLTENFYLKYIKNPSNTPSSSTGGKAFYGIMHSVDSYLGISGIYILFLIIAGFFFLKAFILYKQNKKL